MKIAIIGYGKMGRMVSETIENTNDEIVVVIDNEEDWKKKSGKLSEADVAIEFSVPDAAYNNVIRCLNAGIPVVCGTTGWDEQLDKVKTLIEKNGLGMVYASNFSIGVNIFFELNKRLANIMKNHNEYQVSIEETHHTQKLDAPSGTAKTLANDILSHIMRYEQWAEHGKHKKEEEIPVKAKRVGDVTGIHEIHYNSGIDTIMLKHEAFNRKGFTYGALFAARWIIEQKGFFTMQDILFSAENSENA